MSQEAPRYETSSPSSRGSNLPVLGLMLGDYTGIGPEQCARVLADKRLSDAANLLVVGDARVLAQGQRDAGVRFDWLSYKTPGDVDWNRDEVPIIDLGNLDPSHGFPRGVVVPLSGRIAGETLAYMIELAVARRIDGIVFAPLNKAALHAGGWKFNDEHQMFAHLIQHKGFFGEMNVLDNKWMSRVTSHVSLRTALDQITPERIDDALTLADATMRGAGIARAAHRGRGAESARRRERPLRARGDRDHRARSGEGGARAASRARAPSPPTPCSSRASATSTTACSPCTTTRARSRPS